MRPDPDGLYSLLNEKSLQIADLSDGSFQHRRNIWRVYLNEMGIVPSDVEVCLIDGRDPERFVVVPDPLEVYGVGIGIPEELAKKAVVLGYFSDSPSIERFRETTIDA